MFYSIIKLNVFNELKESSAFSFNNKYLVNIVADSVNRGKSTAKGMRATYMIKLSINKDIKSRTRRRSRKGHVYIYSAKAPAEPLTRVCNNAVTSILSSITVPSIPAP